MRAPIEDYGLLGDTRTAALVGSDGSVDWLCIPRFDGQPVFGQLVGGAAAGSFRLAPGHPAEVVTRGYRPDTATLETTWQTDTGRLTLTEGMVAEVGGRLLPATMLVRRLTAPDGPVEAVITLRPPTRRAAPSTASRAPRRGPGLQLVDAWRWRCARPPPQTIQPGQPTAFTVTPDRPFTCVMSVADREPLVYVDPEAAWEALQATRPDGGPGVAASTTRLPHRDGRGPQPAHPPPADLLPLRGAGRRTDDVAARGARRCPQLGLPLRLAARRQHRHRRLPRSRQAGRGPRLHGLAAQRHPARPSPAPGAAHPARQAPGTRTRAGRLARLRRQRAGPVGQRRGRPAPARRLRLGPRRGLAAQRSRAPPVRRDLAHHGRLRRPGGGPVGASPMPASGRCAPTPLTTCTPS